MDKFQIFIAVLTATAVPAIAFIIRMFEGDTKNENERVISDFLIRTVGKWRTWYKENHGSVVDPA